MEQPMFGTKNGGMPMTAEEQCGAFGPEHITDWLIKYHHMPEESRKTVEINIRSAYNAERAIGFIKGQASNIVHVHFSIFGKK